MKVYSDSSVAHLQRLRSDHCPICLTTILQKNPNVTRPFRFIAAWMEHEQFGELLKESWNMEKGEVVNVDNFRLKLKECNFQSFGYLGYKKRLLLVRLKGIEKRFDLFPSLFLCKLEKDLRDELEGILYQE